MVVVHVLFIIQEEIIKMKAYCNYTNWLDDANLIGWVHIHDDSVVCDDPDTGELLGEFNDETASGWLCEKDEL